MKRVDSTIFRDLDRINQIPFMKSLDLKTVQIVVIGDESSGKSLSLQRITGLMKKYNL